MTSQLKSAKRPDFPKYQGALAARAEITAAVHDFFQSHKLARSGGARLAFKIITLFAWAIASYVVILQVNELWQIAAMSVVFGVAVAGIGLCVQHENNHGAGFQSRRWSRFFGYSLDLIGGSSYYWRWSHGLHHRYPNVEKLDNDIDIAPFLRLASWQQHRWLHKYQHIYVWLLYTIMVPKWNLYDDYRDILRGQLGEVPVARPRGQELWLFVLFRVIFYGWCFALPVLIHGWLTTALIYVTWSATTGLILGSVFQLGHLTDACGETTHPGQDRDLSSDYFSTQLANTANFRVRSGFMTWYLGGLNFQIEHHLFPHISHVHYPQVAVLVEAICREHGLPYNCHASYFNALGHHARHLRALGRCPE